MRGTGRVLEADLGGGRVVVEHASGIELRIARSADAEAIVSLVESAYRGESSRRGWTTEADLLDGQRTDLLAVRAHLQEPKSEILLGESGGQLLGCCQLQGQGSTAHFGLFAVRPGSQGKGIGRWLMGHAEQRAKERFGASAIRMSVIRQRVELISWYERHGYHRTGEYLAFPYGDERFGVPRRGDLEFAVLEKSL